MSQLIEANLSLLTGDQSRENLEIHTLNQDSNDERIGLNLEFLVSEIDEIITEDDEPVDNLSSETQQRLLSEALYSSREQVSLTWPFLVAVNVGLFYEIKQRPIVPDVFLSLGVQMAKDWWAKKHRSYFVWEFGNVPEVVIEIVSNKVGEDGAKMGRYASMEILYYVIFDPQEQLSAEILRVYELDSRTGRRRKSYWLLLVGLGLTLWDGDYEGKQNTWLRWCNEAGTVIPTGHEQTELERQQRVLAQQEVELERQRSLRLLAQLRALGFEPED